MWSCSGGVAISSLLSDSDSELLVLTSSSGVLIPNGSYWITCSEGGFAESAVSGGVCGGGALFEGSVVGVA